jgi:hypothetical protein
MKQRRKQEEHDPLALVPEFRTEVVSVSIRGRRERVMLSVICPRCGAGFLAGRTRWKREKFKTRPCPYCFKVSRP